MQEHHFAEFASAKSRAYGNRGDVRVFQNNPDSAVRNELFADAADKVVCELVIVQLLKKRVRRPRRRERLLFDSQNVFDVAIRHRFDDEIVVEAIGSWLKFHSRFGTFAAGSSP
jgi:hypothetical protein